MLLLMLSVGLAALSQSDAGLMGGPKCTWGPTYWCANIPQVVAMLTYWCANIPQVVAMLTYCCANIAQVAMLT